MTRRSNRDRNRQTYEAEFSAGSSERTASQDLQRRGAAEPTLHESGCGSPQLGRRERIRLLLNVEGAVCIGSVGEYPKLDHLSGTVVRVGRSYAIVRFENGENWKLLFEDVCRIEDKANRRKIVSLC
jgi:hypothetical protein